MNSPAGCPLAPDSVTSADTIASRRSEEDDAAAAAAAGTLLAKLKEERGVEKRRVQLY